MADYIDNIIWRSLSTRHAQFALTNGTAAKFIADIGPLAGFSGDIGQGMADVAPLVEPGGTFAIFTPQAFEPLDGWDYYAGGGLDQMVREKSQLPDIQIDSEILTLGAADNAEMRALADLTRPGPFAGRTHELGNYFGVRVDGRLVAMAGERLKVAGFTEISAVCTHPDHLGKGYAAALMSHVAAKIEARGETALLHTRADNARAIAVYERLGFQRRWSGHFAALRKK